jgi:hypothetical protein
MPWRFEDALQGLAVPTGTTIGPATRPGTGVHWRSSIFIANSASRSHHRHQNHPAFKKKAMRSGWIETCGVACAFIVNLRGIGQAIRSRPIVAVPALRDKYVETNQTVSGCMQP